MPYHGYYYGIDMYYIVLVLPCVLFAFWAQTPRMEKLTGRRQAR